MTTPTSMDLGGGGSASFQFPNGLGTTGRATILDFRTEQQTHYEDGPPGSGIKKGEPKFFSDGKPMTKVVVDLQTAYRNSEGLKNALPAGADDGKRTVHLQAHKAPDDTSSMQAVMAATIPLFGKGRIRIGDDMELIGLGEVKTKSGQLAKKHTANYWLAEQGVDLAAAPAAAPGPAVVVPTVPQVPAPAPSAAVPAPAASAPAPAAGSPLPAADPLLANLTPAQLAVLGQAVPPPPAAVPAPPVAVPPPPPADPHAAERAAYLANGWTLELLKVHHPHLVA